MKVFRIYNIDWDTEGQELDLPTEVNLEIMHENGEEVNANLPDEALAWISDQLSEAYDWMVNDFDYKLLLYPVQ